MSAVNRKNNTNTKKRNTNIIKKTINSLSVSSVSYKTNNNKKIENLIDSMQLGLEPKLHSIARLFTPLKI